MMFTVGSRMLMLLSLAARFAQPEEGDGGSEGGAGKEGDGGAGGEGKKKTDPPGGKEGEQDKKKDPPTDDKKPVPFARFSEVSKARRTAERSLATATAEVETLKAQLAQAQSGDQAAGLKTAQAEVTELKKSIQTIDDEFEDMLEVALADVDEEDAKMIREIPGGARAQFAWFNKHRARLAGGETAPTDDKKKAGVKGPKNEKKPDGDGKPGPSGAAKSYVDQSKPKEKGFAGLA